MGILGLRMRMGNFLVVEKEVALLVHCFHVKMKFRMFIDAEGANPEDPPCDVRSGNRPLATVVGGEHSHYHGIHAPQADSKHHFLSL